jgi:hypothetical protein
MKVKRRLFLGMWKGNKKVIEAGDIMKVVIFM